MSDIAASIHISQPMNGESRRSREIMRRSDPPAGCKTAVDAKPDAQQDASSLLEGASSSSQRKTASYAAIASIGAQLSTRTHRHSASHKGKLRIKCLSYTADIIPISPIIKPGCRFPNFQMICRNDLIDVSNHNHNHI